MRCATMINMKRMSYNEESNSYTATTDVDLASVELPSQVVSELLIPLYPLQMVERVEMLFPEMVKRLE